MLSRAPTAREGENRRLNFFFFPAVGPSLQVEHALIKGTVFRVCAGNETVRHNLGCLSNLWKEHSELEVSGNPEFKIHL